MELTTVWFMLIAVLWIGYFVLEGFDFGVGILLPVLGRDDRERRVLVNTIGPLWDGNEVWLLVAGGATFAAFPEWYATLFSGFYLPLFLILISLILRNVAFEFRGKRDDVSWRAWWDRAIFYGSLLPAILWGVAFGNIVGGVDIDAEKEYVGTFFDLLNPYAILGGLVTLTLFVTHGAVFLSLKTVGEVRERARGIALKSGLAAAVVAVAFLGWTYADNDGAQHAGWFVALAAVAAVALLAGLEATRRGREGWAFIGTATRHHHGRGIAVHGAVPERDAVVARRRLVPHHHERRLDQQDADDHDLGGRHLHAARAALPGLVDLRVPQADRRAAHPRRLAGGRRR